MVTHCAECCTHILPITTWTLYVGHPACPRQTWASKASLHSCHDFPRTTRVREIVQHPRPMLTTSSISLRILVHILDCCDLLQTFYFPEACLCQSKCLLSWPEQANHRPPYPLPSTEVLGSSLKAPPSYSPTPSFRGTCIGISLPRQLPKVHPWPFISSYLALPFLLKALHLFLFHLSPASLSYLEVKSSWFYSLGE